MITNMRNKVVPMLVIQLGGYTYQPIVNLRDELQVIPLMFPLDVSFPDVIGSKIQTHFHDCTFALFTEGFIKILQMF